MNAEVNRQSPGPGLLATLAALPPRTMRPPRELARRPCQTAAPGRRCDGRGDDALVANRPPRACSASLRWRQKPCGDALLEAGRAKAENGRRRWHCCGWQRCRRGYGTTTTRSRCAPVAETCWDTVRDARGARAPG